MFQWFEISQGKKVQKSSWSCHFVSIISASRTFPNSRGLSGLCGTVMSSAYLYFPVQKKVVELQLHKILGTGISEKHPCYF